MHTSWVARFGAGWRLAVYGSEGALLAEAGGHTGHFPVRLRGARVGDDGLRELVPAAGTATEPFAALIRRSRPTTAPTCLRSTTVSRRCASPTPWRGHHDRHRRDDRAQDVRRCQGRLPGQGPAPVALRRGRGRDGRRAGQPARRRAPQPAPGGEPDVPARRVRPVRARAVPRGHRAHGGPAPGRGQRRPRPPRPRADAEPGRAHRGHRPAEGHRRGDGAARTSTTRSSSRAPPWRTPPATRTPSASRSRGRWTTGTPSSWRRRSSAGGSCSTGRPRARTSRSPATCSPPCSATTRSWTSTTA